MYEFRFPMLNSDPDPRFTIDNARLEIHDSQSTVFTVARLRGGFVPLRTNTPTPALSANLRSAFGGAWAPWRSGRGRKEEGAEEREEEDRCTVLRERRAALERRIAAAVVAIAEESGAPFITFGDWSFPERERPSLFPAGMPFSL